MIGHLTGRVLFLDTDSLVLDVGGVGYTVTTHEKLLHSVAIESQISLFIHTQVSQEKIELFGFETQIEKNWFQRLINVNGIGPRMGVALLGRLPLDEFAHAIVNEDSATLATVKGIGPRTAKRLIIDMKDWMQSQPINPASQAIASKAQPVQLAHTALVQLGCTSHEASQLLAQIDTEASSDAEQLIVRALAVRNSGKND